MLRRKVTERTEGLELHLHHVRFYTRAAKDGSGKGNLTSIMLDPNGA